MAPVSTFITSIVGKAAVSPLKALASSILKKGFRKQSIGTAMFKNTSFEAIIEVDFDEISELLIDIGAAEID